MPLESSQPVRVHLEYHIDYPQIYTMTSYMYSYTDTYYVIVNLMKVHDDMDAHLN